VGFLHLEKERKRSVSEFVVSTPAQLPCWSASFSFTIILFTVLFVLFMAADAENVIDKEETTQSRCLIVKSKSNLQLQRVSIKPSKTLYFIGQQDSSSPVEVWPRVA